jgi:hypothetical protein
MNECVYKHVTWLPSRGWLLRRLLLSVAAQAAPSYHTLEINTEHNLIIWLHYHSTYSIIHCNHGVMVRIRHLDIHTRTVNTLLWCGQAVICHYDKYNMLSELHNILSAYSALMRMSSLISCTKWYTFFHSETTPKFLHSFTPTTLIS